MESNVPASAKSNVRRLRLWRMGLFRYRGHSQDDSDTLTPRSVAAEQEYTDEPFANPTSLSVVDAAQDQSYPIRTVVVAFSQLTSDFLFLFSSWGIVGCYGTFLVYFHDTMLPTYSASAIAVIGSVQYFLAVLVGVVTSPWVDQGHMQWMCTVGSILTVLGIMMDSLSTSYVHVFFAHGVCLGLGAGLLYLPSISCVSEYFTMHRGGVLTLASLGSTIGSIIFPIMFNTMEPSIGYPWAVRIIGFLMMGCLLVALVLSTPRQERVPARRLWSSQAWTDLPYAFFLFSYFLCMAGVQAPNFYFPLYGKHRHYSPSIYPFATSFLKSGAAVGRLLNAMLSQQFGVMHWYLPRTLIGAVLVYCWIASDGQGSYVAIIVLYGFFTSNVLSSMPKIVSDLTDNPADVSVRLGMASMVSSVGVLLGPPVAGALLVVEPPNFLHAQIFMGSVMTASCLGLFFVRYVKTI